MPRPALLLLTALLVAIGAVQVVLFAHLRPAGVAGLASPAAGQEVVRRFYAAANAVIATGDPAPLSAVLAPDYAEPDASGALVPGRAALERSLLALHATAPGLWLEVDELVGDGERMVAVVRLRGAADAAAFGLALADPVLWGPVELFRVAGDRVAERASASDRPVLLEPLVRAPTAVAPPAGRVVSTVRVAIEPGGWRRASGVDGLRLLVVEAGALAVDVAPAGDPTASPGDPLGAGDWLVVPDGRHGPGYTARNPGPAPAVLLEVLATFSPPPRGGEPPAAEGAAARVLAGGQSLAVPTGPAVLAAGRATLPPGARLAWAGPAGPTLLVVEAGTLELATVAGSSWIRRTAGAVELPNGSATLAAGDGALLRTSTDVEVRNGGDAPLALLVVTLIGAPDEPSGA